MQTSELWRQERNRLLVLASEAGIEPMMTPSELRGVRGIAEALILCLSEREATELLRQDREGTRAFLLVISCIEDYEPVPGEQRDEADLTPFGNLIKAIWRFLPSDS